MTNLFQELDSPDRKFGSGWISGVLGLFLAIAGLATVFCFLFPQIFTVEEARSFYAKYYIAIRILLSAALIAAFFSVLSALCCETSESSVSRR